MRVLLTFLLFTMLLWTKSGFATGAKNLEEARGLYCQKPPFIQQDVYANVMLVIDISGSMKADVYRNSYYKTNTYKGLFFHDGYYLCYLANKNKYLSKQTSCTKSGRYWVKVLSNLDAPYDKYKQVTINGKTYKATSGNYLNWLRMKRMDIIKWVLTGGKTRSWAGTTVVESLYGQKIYYKDVTSYNSNTNQVEGVLHKISRLSKKPRIGAYFYSSGGRYIWYKIRPKYDYSGLISEINNKTGYYATPTGPALRDTQRYFSKINGRYGGFAINNTTNPYRFKIGNTYQEAPCTKNYVILFTDGEWNVGEDPVKPAYDMWKGGTADLVNSLDGKQNAKVYAVALFLDDGYGKNAVKHIAIFGGFEDKDGNKKPCGYNSTYYNSFRPIKNISGMPCQAEWDEDNDGLPDTYAEGSDPDKVKEAIEGIFTKIINKIASGTSVAALSAKNSKGAILTQSVFYAGTKWIGYLYAYWFLNTNKAQNIREDTVQDLKLKILEDNILQFKINTSQELKIDVCKSNSNGTIKTPRVCTTKNLNELKHLWEAGEKLKNKSASSRILYSVGTNNQMKEFKTSNKSSFIPYLGNGIDQFPKCLLKNNGSQIDYDKVINYLRGVDYPGCRSRKFDNTSKVWKLADIIYSTPKIVTYNNYSVAYVASNDGVLHAFKVGKLEKLSSNTEVAKLSGNNLGEELWGFIPRHALPYIRYLADPDYCHMYIQDLSPYIVEFDGKIGLIGGFRLAGGCGCSGSNCVNPPDDTCSSPGNSSCKGLSGYYMLDITDPANPKYMWEFVHPDLRFATSGPGVIKVKDGSNDKFYVVFVSGPENYEGIYQNNTSGNTMKIFILDLSTGNLLRTIDTGIRKAFGGRIFSNGVDINEDGYTDYLAFGYTRQDGSTTNYKGGVIILAGHIDGQTLIPLHPDYNAWRYVNYTSFGTDIPPITAKVEFMKCFNRWYMYVGSGRWFQKNDDYEVGTNRLFGIPIKPVPSSGGTYDYSSIYGIEIITATADVTNPSQASNICQDNNQTQDVRGWYINLSNSSSQTLKEKMISDPSVSNKDIILFTTIRPSGKVCGLGGDTRVWALNCALGSSITYECPGFSVDKNIQFNFLLQLSGGDIQEFRKNSFTQNGGRTSEYKKGIASEQGGIPLFPGTVNYKGEILLWIER